MQALRDAIATVDLMLGKSKFEMKKATLEQYKAGLRAEMISKGEKQIKIIEDFCIEVAGSPLTLIFFKKLTADTYRYLAELKGTSDRLYFKEQALKSYEESLFIHKCHREF